MNAVGNLLVHPPFLINHKPSISILILFNFKKKCNDVKSHYEMKLSNVYKYKCNHVLKTLKTEVYILFSSSFKKQLKEHVT